MPTRPSLFPPHLYVQARCFSSVSLYCFFFDLVVVSVSYMRCELLWFVNLLEVDVVKCRFSLLGNN